MVLHHLYVSITFIKSCLPLFTAFAGHTLLCSYHPELGSSKWPTTFRPYLHVFIASTGHTARIYRLICTGDFIFSSCYDKTCKAWLFDQTDSDDEDEEDEANQAEKMCIRTFKVLMIRRGTNYRYGQDTDNELHLEVHTIGLLWGSDLKRYVVPHRVPPQGHSLAVYPIVYIPSETELPADDSDDEDTIVINPLDIVITGSADNTAKSWSFDSGSCLKTFKVRTWAPWQPRPRAGLLTLAAVSKHSRWEHKHHGNNRQELVIWLWQLSQDILGENTITIQITRRQTQCPTWIRLISFTSHFPHPLLYFVAVIGWFKQRRVQKYWSLILN